MIEVPVADGGEGTVDALVAAHHGKRIELTVNGPLGDPVTAVYGLIEGGRSAVVELASASGLPLLPKERRDPRVTTTYGFGQVLEAARRRGIRTLVAGIGGSATNDGGAGMGQALGFRLLDARGDDLPPGGAALARLARIDASGVDPGWRKVRVRVACDVTNPLCGPEGATAVYGPQKGATPEMIDELDRALAHFADVVARDLRKEVRDVPGAGAAGGTGAGLLAFLDAELVRGAPLIVEASGLDRALPGARLVVTGEGRVDRQTAYGKGPSEVMRRAGAAGVPVVLIAGSLGEGWETLGAPVVPLEGDPDELLARPAEHLERAASRVAQEMLA